MSSAAMGFHSLKCFQLALVGVLFSHILVPAAAFGIPKPDCPDRCGNLSIPFPFGVGDGCYLDKYFNITCNSSYHPPKPYLAISTIEVSEISVDGSLTIQMPAARNCFDQNSGDEWTQELNLTWFTISKSRNTFTVVGCNSVAYLEGKGSHDREYQTGCLSVCEEIDYYSCPGSGCCQMGLPDELYFANVTAYIYNVTKDVSGFRPCTYAFITEEGKLKKSRSQLNATFPVVLDWSLDKQSTNETQACKVNALPYQRKKKVGFLCKCAKGYEGNPYMGCSDIDECKSETLNNCMHQCMNTYGNYTCSCPKWYVGDGRKDGKGCVLRLFPIILIICCSIGLVIPFVVALVWWSFRVVKRKRAMKLKKQFFKRNGGLLLKQQVSYGGDGVEMKQQVSSGGDGVEMNVKLFTSKEIKKATDNYNKNRILGDGGQGTVYKGMLEDGKIVAIKKSKLIDENQLGQFINEVVLLQQINHRNVVKLLGCCLETEVPMLVYEFISNGMLSHYLYGQDKDFLMTWDMRLRIAVEVADALFYLHSAASNPIYHCDIKSANILLDDKYRAKVADFGISRSIELDKTHLTMPNVQGTFGYLDPEYFQTSKFTDKSDVYSFGVVLIELMTGQKPIMLVKLGNQKSLVNHFLLAMEEDRLFEIVDVSVGKGSPKEAIMAVALLAKRCLNMVGRKRPTMREVAMELQKIRGPQGAFVTEQREKELEHEILQHWEVASTSTTTFGNSYTAFSSDTEPLTSDIQR